MFKSVSLLIGLMLPLAALAQVNNKTSWELGAFLGGSNYLGDLAPDISLQATRPALGLGIKYDFNTYFAAGLQLNTGWISGNDSNFEANKYRGLAFSSNILELMGNLEFNFFRFGTAPRDRQFTPYLYTGLSFFKFNPVNEYQGDKYYLQRMSTEGQGLIDDAPERYSLLQFAIPIGAGMKFHIADNWNLAIHGAYRATFTDYLDDVSDRYIEYETLSAYASPQSAALADPNKVAEKGNKQRGNQYATDWYVFAGVSLSYILLGSDCYTFGR
jgi:hypothetical protein